MRLMLRLVLALLLAPLVLVLLVVVAAAAIAGLPLLWEALIRTYTAPPQPPAAGE